MTAECLRYSRHRKKFLGVQQGPQCHVNFPSAFKCPATYSKLLLGDFELLANLQLAHPSSRVNSSFCKFHYPASHVGSRDCSQTRPQLWSSARRHRSTAKMSANKGNSSRPSSERTWSSPTCLSLPQWHLLLRNRCPSEYGPLRETHYIYSSLR